MEKNKIHPIQSGKNMRMSFASREEALKMPNLVGIQKDSYDWFLKEGLKEVFDDIVVSSDLHGTRKETLEFTDYRLCADEARYTIEECKERDITYQAPLKVKVRLTFQKDSDFGENEIRENEITMGELPLMTDTGSFIVNGAERVIVSQIVRSPGIYYTVNADDYGVDCYSCQVIPSRGNWLEYEIDSKNAMWVLINHATKGKNKNKIPFTWLVRTLNYVRERENERAKAAGLPEKPVVSLTELFGIDPVFEATCLKEPSLRRKVGRRTKNQVKPEATKTNKEGAEEFYAKFHPDEEMTDVAIETYLPGMLCNEQHYDLAHVGRHKFNKKLDFINRLTGQKLAEDLKVNGHTYSKRTVITEELATAIQDNAIGMVKVFVTRELFEEKDGETVRKTEEIAYPVYSNQMVDADKYLASYKIKSEDVGIMEKVYYPVLKELLDSGEKGDKLKKLLKSNLRRLVPSTVQYEEIIASVNYALGLKYGIGHSDDIDHLGNRRIRAVGELLQNQFRIGMNRVSKSISDRMAVQGEDASPTSLINIKPLTAAIKEFFGSSQLSQFMDQGNPLSELTHKRRLSALGSGGLTRERATFEVRDIHYTHYGRMCPIETPEGPNIGLITSLAMYARINRYGFIEAPYRKVDKTEKNHPRVTDEIVYLDADEEDKYTIAQANTPIDENGYFLASRVSGRCRDKIAEFDKNHIDFMDVSPKMVFSVATAMIPFLANDDANRALMGSNMQRQAVPLMITEAPVVDTGLAEKAAVDSGVCVIAKRSGTVVLSSSQEIDIKADKTGEIDKYILSKFERSNQTNSYNQKPIVYKGDYVEAGSVIADGPSTCNGELSLGKNPLIGFMTWEGYNYEDAVLISERLVQEDVYTSIHVEEYQIEERITKLGSEQITSDIPNISNDEKSALGLDGIVCIGTEVRAGDILVGKVSPKGETEMTPEERLLRAILGKNSEDVRDTSLRLPHGAYGTVVAVKTFKRGEDKVELQANVNKKVCVYVAQKRKISVGDKMAGRHGNKGVVSRILPVEDMPYLPNGRPLDIVLNPLGVPSRMNIGQVLEMHLSLAAKVLGFNVSTPIFDGASEKDIGDLLEIANDYANMENFKDFKEKYKDVLQKNVMTYLGDHLENRELWKGVPISRDGKVQLRDGRTGELFDAPVTVGHMNYLKLHHLVDDKIHARAIGPYSLVTQQPLGGKAQFGGQRFGEMEVWALEAYGASHTLQEVLTVKSDDITGRTETYKAIIKGDPLPKPGVPESFKVMLKELQSLALDVRVYDAEKKEIKIEGHMDDDNRSSSRSVFDNATIEKSFNGAFQEPDMKEDDTDADDDTETSEEEKAEFDFQVGTYDEVHGDLNNGGEE